MTVGTTLVVVRELREWRINARPRPRTSFRVTRGQPQGLSLRFARRARRPPSEAVRLQGLQRRVDGGDHRAGVVPLPQQVVRELVPPLLGAEVLTVVATGHGAELLFARDAELLLELIVGDVLAKRLTSDFPTHSGVLKLAGNSSRTVQLANAGADDFAGEALFVQPSFSGDANDGVVDELLLELLPEQ